MNNLNYASREASQRLVDAGIVLETEKVWFFSTTGWELVDRYTAHPVNRHYLPAPSMAEVWRELPKKLPHRGYIVEPHLCKREDTELHYASYAWEPSGGFYEVVSLYENTNPSDALIDLLIWVRKEKP